jgi:hypothetical protein
VLELAGASSLGKGERAVRKAEVNKASKRVREGMVSKQKEREGKSLEEVRNPKVMPKRPESNISY